jgi:hypothetical protein
VVSRSNFSANSGDFGGGAFLVETSSLNVTDSQVLGHTANSGGVLYAIGAAVLFERCVLAGNGGLSYEGGGFYLSASSSLTSLFCNFSGNQVRRELLKP